MGSPPKKTARCGLKPLLALTICALSLGLSSQALATEDLEARKNKEDQSGLGLMINLSYTLEGLGYAGSNEFGIAGQPGLMPTVAGYRFRERGGFISGLITGALVYTCLPLLVGAPAGTTTYLGSDGSYDYYSFSTTQGEIDAANARIKASQEGGVAMMGAPLQSFELDVYQRGWAGSDYGDASGYKVWMMFPVGGDADMLFELGWGWSSVQSDLTTTDGSNQQWTVDHFFLGVPLRLSIPFGRFYASATWALNMSALMWLFDDEEDHQRFQNNRRVWEVRPSPLSLDINGHLGPIVASVGVMTPGITTLELGVRGSVGLRF